MFSGGFLFAMMRRHSIVKIVFLAAGTFAVHAQAVRPAYDVASVKVNVSGSGDSSTRGTPGHIVFTNQTLKHYIERAYNLKPFQIAGPDWLENVHFDIVAKYPPDTKNEDRSLMLQSLLEDRFKLAVHRESKEMEGYALVVAKGGFKLQSVDAGGNGGTNTNGNGHVLTLTAKKTSMAELAGIITNNLSEMVVDRTGVEGLYDFALRWSPDEQNSGGADAAPSLFTAIQETLGLRLQAQKVPVNIVVIDHIEREPTEN